MALGQRLGTHLKGGSVLCLFGDLGAGKTTFVKGVVAGATSVDPAQVFSPTFTYLHIYEGEKPVFHFDLYRLPNIDEFVRMGFDEYFDREGICCIEWAEKIKNYLPKGSLQVVLSHVSEGVRKIDVKSALH